MAELSLLQSELQYTAYCVWRFQAKLLFDCPLRVSDRAKHEALLPPSELKPSPLVRYALEQNTVVDSHQFQASTAAADGSPNDNSATGGAMQRSALAVPFRMDSDLVHVWEFCGGPASDIPLDTTLLARLCGTLYLLSLSMRGEPHIKADSKSQSLISPREIEVLTWCKAGKTYAEIASILGISAKTVDYHMTNIMRKLNANDKLTAVLTAARMGLIGI